MIVITDVYFLINKTCIPCNFALDYSLNFSATPLPRTQALPSVWIPLHSYHILLPPSLLRLLLHIETPFPSFCSVLNILLKLVLTISFLFSLLPYLTAYLRFFTWWPNWPLAIKSSHCQCLLMTLEWDLEDTNPPAPALGTILTVFNTLQALPTTDPLHLLCPPPETFFSTYLPKSHGFVIHIIQISTQMLLSEKPPPTTLSEITSFSPFDHTLFLSLVFYFCSIYLYDSEHLFSWWRLSK